MTTNFQKPFTCLLISASISACSFMGNTEINTLKQVAIQDAHKTSKELKLDYMRCYALQDFEKEKCHQILGSKVQSRNNASTWEYIRPFDSEMEHEGFAMYLRDQGKICSGVDKDPEILEIITGTYKVTCTGGQTYKMRFDLPTIMWELVK